MSARVRIMRTREWARPVAFVEREVSSASPAVDQGLPPVLFVPGFGHGAWVFAEHWLERAAERGVSAYAMSLRGHGSSGPGPDATLRAYVHDVVQVAAGLPRQAVLVGHGAGALVVARALARYPARAGVLVAPVLGGWATLGTALLRNPLGTLPALLGGPLRLSRRQLFSRELPATLARSYARRVGAASPTAQWQLLAHRAPEPPVGDPPMLVLGSPDDRVVGPPALARAAEPIDAIVDWLAKLSR
jgi:pimeloyl-ACP methyl ester carboxylesterase